MEYCEKCKMKYDADNGGCDCQERWNSVEKSLPELMVPVWLWRKGVQPWIGGRYPDGVGSGWCWTNSHFSVWHNGQTWECDAYFDDDYAPTHWMHLPELPDAN